MGHPADRLRRRDGRKPLRMIVRQSGEIICNHLRWGQLPSAKRPGVRVLPGAQKRGTWGTHLQWLCSLLPAPGPPAEMICKHLRCGQLLAYRSHGVCGFSTEIRGQRSENRDQRTEISCQWSVCWIKVRVLPGAQKRGTWGTHLQWLCSLRPAPGAHAFSDSFRIIFPTYLQRNRPSDGWLPALQAVEGRTRRRAAGRQRPPGAHRRRRSDRRGGDSLCR
jgi:hypothetical protein